MCHTFLRIAQFSQYHIRSYFGVSNEISNLFGLSCCAIQICIYFGSTNGKYRYMWFMWIKRFFNLLFQLHRNSIFMMQKFERYLANLHMCIYCSCNKNKKARAIYIWQPEITHENQLDVVFARPLNYTIQWRFYQIHMIWWQWWHSIFFFLFSPESRHYKIERGHNSIKFL